MWKFFVIFGVFVTGINGWDQLQPAILQKIFPFIAETTVEHLRTAINANNTVLALLSLDDWINANWVKPPNTINTAAYGRLTGKQYSWELAIGLLGHRGAVRSYIQYLKGATRVLKYLEEEQIDKMTARFWQTDLTCSNNFTCTEPSFLTGIGPILGVHHENATRDLTNLASAAHKLEDFQHRLGWKFEI